MAPPRPPPPRKTSCSSDEEAELMEMRRIAQAQVAEAIAQGSPRPPEPMPSTSTGSATITRNKKSTPKFTKPAFEHERNTRSKRGKLAGGPSSTQRRISPVGEERNAGKVEPAQVRPTFIPAEPGDVPRTVPNSPARSRGTLESELAIRTKQLEEANLQIRNLSDQMSRIQQEKDNQAALNAQMENMSLGAMVENYIETCKEVHVGGGISLHRKGRLRNFVTIFDNFLANPGLLTPSTNLDTLLTKLHPRGSKMGDDGRREFCWSMLKRPLYRNFFDVAIKAFPTLKNLMEEMKKLLGDWKPEDNSDE